MGKRGTERWEGGYIRRDARGRPVYVIHAMRGGRQYEVSTRCSTLRAAMKELERWEADPSAYDLARAARATLQLDERLVAEFMAESARRGASSDWRRVQRKLLAWWMAELGASDLRRVPLSAIVEALPKEGRKNRIAVLKRLYAWLRQTGRVTTAEDPTFGRLQVPQSTPEQHTRSKVVSRADYEKVRAKLAGVYRDALDVLAATGWHVSELHRFAQGGAVEPYHGKQKGVAGVLMTPLHKSGGAHRTAVGPEALAAAKRLRANEGLGVTRFHSAVLQACDAVKVTRFGPGQLRHSVATWAVEAGADPAAVAAFLGHRSASTTKRFYATLAVPPKVPTLR